MRLPSRPLPSELPRIERRNSLHFGRASLVNLWKKWWHKPGDDLCQSGTVKISRESFPVPTPVGMEIEDFAFSPGHLFQTKPLNGHTGTQPKKSLGLLLIYGTIVVLGATATLSYAIVRNLILDNLKSNALLQVQKSGNDLDEWLSGLMANLEAAANHSAVRSLDWSVARPYLQLEVERVADFYMLNMATSDGSYYSTEVGFVEGRNISDREHFQRSLAGEANASDVVRSRSTGIIQIAIAGPIWSIPPLNSNLLQEQDAQLRAENLRSLNLPPDAFEKPKPIGALLGTVSLDRITEVVNNITAGQGSYAFALDSKGVPLAHPNPEHTHEIQSFLNSSDLVLSEITQKMVNRLQGVELVQLAGESVYVAYAPIDRARWSIALVIPRYLLEQKLAALNILASILGAMLVIATVGVLRQMQLFDRTRQLAASEALLNRLTARIRESLELETILQTTVDEVANLLDLDRVTFGWYRTDEHKLEIVCERRDEELPGLLGAWDLEPFADLGDRLSRCELVCYHNIATERSLDSTLKQMYLKIGAASYLALPVSMSGKIPGYLTCIRSIERRWSDREFQLLEAVADQIAIAIEQSHLYAQTQEQVKIVSEQAEQLRHTLTELQKTQSQLIQSEKMSGLGQLVAGIAHEINNPVNFIYGNLTYTNDYSENLLELVRLYQEEYPHPSDRIQDYTDEIELDFIIEDLPNILSSMKVGAERIRQIVLSLRNFSRYDEADMKAVDIHEGIESTLLILQNRLKPKAEFIGITVVKDYGNLPLVECYAGQLNQVLMNLLANAIDALEMHTAWGKDNREEKQQSAIEEQCSTSQAQSPTIRIRTETVNNNFVKVRISDNGCGMSEKVKNHLFEPFFTTKPIGKGTGLGLSISYQIITEKHKGLLQCVSEPGRGTEFVIEIPVRQI